MVLWLYWLLPRRFPTVPSVPSRAFIWRRVCRTTSQAPCIPLNADVDFVLTSLRPGSEFRVWLLRAPPEGAPLPATPSHRLRPLSFAPTAPRAHSWQRAGGLAAAQTEVTAACVPVKPHTLHSAHDSLKAVGDLMAGMDYLAGAQWALRVPATLADSLGVAVRRVKG